MGGQELNQSSIKTGNLQRSGNDEKSLKKNEKEELKTLGEKEKQKTKQNEIETKQTNTDKRKGIEISLFTLLGHTYMIQIRLLFL